jgi:hypothetical protein
MSGRRRIFPKEHAKGAAIGTGSLPKLRVFSFGGLGSDLVEQVARDVYQGEYLHALDLNQRFKSSML